jgi:hypothetical protein
MQVHVADIRRSDWVRSIPYIYVRRRVNWVLPGIVAGGAFAVYIGMLVVNGQVSFGWVLLAAVCAAVSGLVTLLANLIFHVVAIAARAKKAGLLHPFSLMLDGDGLHIQSARGESLLKWSGVAFVRRNRDYIFVGITPYTFF